MIVSPVLTYGRLSLQDSEGRSTGLHMSDLYSDLYQRLEPQRFNKSTPMDPVRLAAGLAFEKALESALVRELGPQLGGERPGEFIVQVNGTSLAFTPDLIITDASGWMLGEIKCTWMSCFECPLSRAMVDAAGLSPTSVNWDGLDPDVTFPAKFDKFFTQMKSYCYHLSMTRARLIVYFVNGDWRPPVPCLLSWDFTFNEQELAEEWAKLYHHGTRVMGVF